MKLITRTIFSGVLVILGAITACIAGVIAENHQIGDMPSHVSIIGMIGLMCFIVGLSCLAILIIIGGEE